MTQARVGPFLLIDPPPGQAEVITRAIGLIDYPWERLDAALARDPEGVVVVRWTDMGGQVSGLFQSSTYEIHLSAWGGTSAAFVFAHEVGHLVDRATLTTAAKDALTALMHEGPFVQLGHFNHDHPDAGHGSERWSSSDNGYVSRINECYADQFVAAFAPSLWDGTAFGVSQRYPRFTHWTDDHERVRELTLASYRYLPLTPPKEVPPVATDGWYVPALDDFAPSDGGSHTGPVTVGVLHTTESTRFIPNGENYFGHSSYPHFTCYVVGGVFKVWQHISIRRAGRALKNQAGGVQTNREGVVQIEIVGSATRPFTNDPVMVEGLAKLMRWIESETDIPRSTGVDFIAYPASYGERAKQRLSFTAWTSYAGWLGHQHVPENDHGDPGAIDINALLGVTVPSGSLVAPPATTPAPIPATTGEKRTMWIVKDPERNHQYKTDGFRKLYLDGPAYTAWLKAGCAQIVLPLAEFVRLDGERKA